MLEAKICLREEWPEAELWSRGVVERAFFGQDATFHHVGMAVNSIASIDSDCESVVNENEGVAMAFLRLSGITIELLEPLGDASPIMSSLRNGAKLLHLCFEVPDLAEAVRLSRAAGFHRLGVPKPSPAFGGRNVVWVFSKQYGLFELLQRSLS